ncbi:MULTISPECIES: helix-turn-helix domain-containing protein [Paenibacillus]|uniref:helix-turn-helix domain-containing protein n=1 Tax=Paenibacillus TaxID=44249 RepID=UPI0022B88BEE|nr:helix-turn-helix transcriptional regulator [Paenibacillus caseinilyticus]MCZ8520159.1 helix-turn-helix transcriptional regulator [Paenibacillus caseinilyticus]
MSIGQAIHDYRKSNRLTQDELAKQLPMDRTTLAKVESGSRELPPALEPVLARMCWKFALKIADERTGGFISNILDDLPNLDLHPAALKDVLLKEINELEQALGGLAMAKHIDPTKRKESAERVWQEMRDVMEKAVVLQGVLEEEFGIDRKSMIAKHEAEVKRGER